MPRLKFRKIEPIQSLTSVSCEFATNATVRNKRKYQMYKIASYVRNLAVIVSLLLSNNAFAGSGDSAVASINLSGNVPEVFSVTARGLPGDLDLTPGVSVTDRLIGILHFKFNENAASI